MYHNKFNVLLILLSIAYNSPVFGQHEDLILNFVRNIYQNNDEFSTSVLANDTKEYFEKAYFRLGKKIGDVEFKSKPNLSIYPKPITVVDSLKIIATYNLIINQDTIKDLNIVREEKENKIYLTNFQVFQLSNVDANLRNRLLQPMHPDLEIEWFKWLMPSEDVLLNYIYAESMFRRYMFGDKMPEDFIYDDIFKYASPAAREGNNEALSILLSWTLVGENPEGTKLFIELCESEVDKGNVYAMYILGKYELELYYKGVSYDAEKYIYWFSRGFKSASHEDPVGSLCMNNLYLIYSGGKGVEQDYEKAFYWLNKGVEKGYYSAYLYLGDIYMKLGNYSEARKVYEKAIENKVSGSYQRISTMIEIGLGGFEKDSQKAERYKKASEYLFFKCADCWEEAEKIANGN